MGRRAGSLLLQRRPWLMARRTYLLLVVSLGFMFLPSSSQEDERDILDLFYDSCDGNNWEKDWEDDVSFCVWYGITCVNESSDGSSDEDDDDQEESVAKINLREFGINCTLPEQIFYLPNMELLDLSGNEAVSVDFSLLDPDQVPTSLSELYLQDTTVTSLDGFDDAFADSLTALNLGGTQLTGPFPEEILNCTSLQVLDLGMNMLSGELPSAIGTNLTDLVILILSHNLLEGELPSSLGSISNLSNVILQYNQFTGELPQELGQLYQLNFLSLNHQVQVDGNTNSRMGGLTGPLLDFANMTNLFFLNLASNHLTGPVPPTLLEQVPVVFSEFLIVDFSDNDITGFIPLELERFQDLRLSLVQNFIAGIPPKLCTDTEWFFGSVQTYGCDAILCPPNTYARFGRQLYDDYPCEACPLGARSFYGSVSCDIMLIQEMPVEPQDDGGDELIVDGDEIPSIPGESSEEVPFIGTVILSGAIAPDDEEVSKSAGTQGKPSSSTNMDYRSYLNDGGDRRRLEDEASKQHQQYSSRRTTTTSSGSRTATMVRQWATTVVAWLLLAR